VPVAPVGVEGASVTTALGGEDGTVVEDGTVEGAATVVPFEQPTSSSSAAAAHIVLRIVLTIDLPS
jgi:hypothetical protein